MIVRAETAADVATIRAVVAAAFERREEADLVDALRASGAALLSLVAEVEGQVVGHVLFSPVTIVPASAAATTPTRGHETAPRASGLAPLAVLPAMQGRGVGSALARAGLAWCRDAGYAVVVVLGDPDYYARFGFVDARRYQLGCEYEAPPGAFQAIELRPGALAGEPAVVRYREELAGV